MKKIIENRLAKTLSVAFVLTVFVLPNQALAANENSVQYQLKQLRQQLDLLQRKQEVSEEIAKSSAEKSANVELSSSGLNIVSNDKKYSFKVKGYAQVDSRNYVEASNKETDQFLIRGARVYFQAKFPNNFSSNVAVDFGGGQSRLSDGHFDWKKNEHFAVRIGKFKGPIGLERRQSDTEGLFVERGLITNLVPSRDIGVGITGEIIPQVLDYAVVYGNGSADLGDSNGDTGNGKDLSARFFVKPFANTEILWLQDFGFGLAGSIGKRDGNSTTATSELPTAYKTTAQNNFFTYSSGVFSNGTASRFNPQLWYYNGSFGSLAEYIVSNNKVDKSGAARTLRNKAWSVIATYVLTGEDASYDGVKPRANFNPDEGKWGAFEIAARVGKLEIDKNTFPTFASRTTSASSVTEKIIGLNWYLNQNIKINFNYSENDFKDGATTGSKDSERAFLSRLQVKF